MSLSESIVGILKLVKGGAEKSSPSSRVLSTVNSADKLSAIITEIGETVLPRSLVFSIAKSELIVDAGSQRLLRIIHCKPETLIGGGDKALVFAGRNDAKLDKQSEQIAAMLCAFVSESGPLEVTSNAPDQVYSVSEVGFTTKALHKACEGHVFKDAPAKAEEKPKEKAVPVKDSPKPSKNTTTRIQKAEPDKPQSPAPLPSGTGQAGLAFFEACKDQCLNISIFSKDGSLIEFSGATKVKSEWEETGKDIVNDITKWISATSAVIETDQLIVLKSPKLEHTSVCFLADSERTVAAVFKNADLTRIMSCATKAFGWGTAG